jgi:hypothetical protein
LVGESKDLVGGMLRVADELPIEDARLRRTLKPAK